MSKLNAKQEIQVMQRAVEIGLETGKCRMSASGKAIVINARNQPLYTGSLDGARCDIERGDLKAEYERALEELRPRFETSAKRAATVAAKKAVADNEAKAALAAVDCLLDDAYAGAIGAGISAAIRAKIAPLSLSTSQLARWNGIVALEARVATERAQKAALATQHAAQKAALAAQRAAAPAPLRVQMRWDERPEIGKAFALNADKTALRVCTGYSKQPWQLSQQQIDDNDDFHLEGVWLTYVYYEERSASMHEITEFLLTKRDEAQVEIDAENARAHEYARVQSLKKMAMAGERAGSDSEPDLSGYEVLAQKKPESIWESGFFLGQNEAEILLIEERPRGGDWMDEQKIYTVYRASRPNS